MPTAFENMDRMYRIQRYFYDFTRKFYLLGRDQLIREMDVGAGHRVLEIGCGTGRNLIILAKRHPQAHFYGLDASAAMLETAAKNAASIDNIDFQNALADDFNFDKTFDLADKFDKMFFSYSISMIPPWRESIENALANLKAGGELYIVDFYDQKELPVVFQKMLQGWLAKFQVKYWTELIPFLESLQDAGRGRLAVISLFRRYAFIAKFISAGPQ